MNKLLSEIKICPFCSGLNESRTEFCTACSLDLTVPIVKDPLNISGREVRYKDGRIIPPEISPEVKAHLKMQALRLKGIGQIVVPVSELKPVKELNLPPVPVASHVANNVASLNSLSNTVASHSNVAVPNLKTKKKTNVATIAVVATLGVVTICVATFLIAIVL